MRVLLIVAIMFTCFMTTSCSVKEQSSETGDEASIDKSVSSTFENDIDSETSPPSESNTWEQTIFVHESCPEYVLQLSGEEKQHVFTELSIVNKSTEIVVYQEHFDWDWGSISKEDFSVEMIDMDFDGYQDIRIFSGFSGDWKQLYIYIMFNAVDGNFVGDTYVLGGLGNPNFNAEKKLVTSMARASAGDSWSYKHQYIDGKLVTIEEVANNLVWDLYNDESTQKQIAALEPLYDDEFSSFLLHQKKQLDAATGELVVVDRKYILYHKLDDDKTMEFSPDSAIGMLLELYEISSEP